MHEVALVSRRGLAALPIAALVGASVAAPVADCASSRIDAAAARCRSVKRALADALDAYERALPAPHPSLDMTSHPPRAAVEAAGKTYWPFTSTVESRLLDRKAPKRGVDRFGRPTERYVATVETIERDLERSGLDPAHVRLLYRMRRRAKARAAEIAALEASFHLEALQADVHAAERVLEELTQALFDGPATSMAAVLVQAKALSVYAETIEAGHAAYQAGRYGKQLAAGLQSVTRAA